MSTHKLKVGQIGNRKTFRFNDCLWILALLMRETEGLKLANNNRQICMMAHVWLPCETSSWLSSNGLFLSLYNNILSLTVLLTVFARSIWLTSHLFPYLSSLVTLYVVKDTLFRHFWCSSGDLERGLPEPNPHPYNHHLQRPQMRVRLTLSQPVCRDTNSLTNNYTGCD